MAGFKTVVIQSCDCRDTAEQLVSNGLFPMTPSAPKYAVSIALLNLHWAIFEHAGLPTNAFAGALHTLYDRGGQRLVDQKVCQVFVSTQNSA
jgi:hypothetical protein